MSTASLMRVKPRILIIDDEPLVVSMLSRLLRKQYTVTATTSGVEGLSLATTEPWDAILCDVMLPELSGPQLLQRLREQGHPAANRMGFMTGGAFGTEATALLEQLGKEGWLAKPFGAAQLEQFVARLLERPQVTE